MGLHLTYYPFVISLVPLIVFFFTKYFVCLQDWSLGQLTLDVSLMVFITYEPLHMLEHLWILDL